MAAHLAIDLGASSGRAILGVIDGQPPQITLHEVHRFAHAPCPTPTGPVWDLTGIWQHVLTGIRGATIWCQEANIELVSVGVDTWGVDWGLIGESGELLMAPHCYRDPQHDAACQRVLKRLGGFDRLYARTGIQLLPFNTIFQLAARIEQEPALFGVASRLLFLPDILHYWLSGELANEITIASTGAMLALDGRQWETALIEELGLPTQLLGELVPPGTILGRLCGRVAAATGASEAIQVVTPASHDTASAIAAVPAIDSSPSWAYLSSGTWSLLGTELDTPITNDAARAVPFTNERGVAGSVRFLKNIAGLWLLQQLREDFIRDGQPPSFEQLAANASQAAPFRTLVDPNAPEFAKPGDMCAKLSAFASRTGQPEPDTQGAFVRCALDSLALCYQHTLGQLQTVLERELQTLHVVGGGVQNQLLNSITADLLGRSLKVGPVEATATGNALVQAAACGTVDQSETIRRIVARSFSCECVEPTNDLGNDPMTRYLEITSQET